MPYIKHVKGSNHLNKNEKYGAADEHIKKTVDSFGGVVI